MTKKEYLQFHRECCERMMSITQAKNADYTGDGDDPFANFSRVEAMGITDTCRGFLVRMLDKVSRITSFVQKGVLQVKDESVEDTLLDLANYCILLAGHIRSTKDKAPMPDNRAQANAAATAEWEATLEERKVNWIAP